MNPFQEELKLFDNIEQGIEEVLKLTLRKHEFEILDYQRNKQLRKGEKTNKQQIGKYSLGYKRLRISKGLQVNHVDLKFSGDFYASMEILVQDDQFIIQSDVPYDKNLVKRYGKNILGLQEEYLEDFTNRFLLPNLKHYLNDKFTK